MAVQSKPIPALYVVYILRSTVRNASLYIGSTPHPPRRLNQHNGNAKGGATRTSRTNLRPWEMVGVVSGFPSMVGALKFEWALNNPHKSLHISPEDRITVSTQRKRSGQLKRPPHSIISILSNLHLLLRVPSFIRWPLKLHLFDRRVHQKWEKYCTTPGIQPLRNTLEVVTDFPPLTAAELVEDRKKAIAKFLTEGFREVEEDNPEQEEDGDSGVAQGKDRIQPGWGIHALPLDHTPLAPYIEKAQEIINFEQEGQCVVCHEHMDHDKGLYAICSNDDCEGVGHLDCWSRHLLRQGEEEDEVILPLQGKCPKCSGTVRWGDMMKELTLRTRGQKEVDKLLKKRKKAATVTDNKAKDKSKGKGKDKVTS